MSPEKCVHVGGMWLRRESGLAANWKVAGMIPGTSYSVEVSQEASPWLLPANWLALHGWHRCWCVNVCMIGWMWGHIVKRFEWPLVSKALHKCRPFIICDCLMSSTSSHDPLANGTGPLKGCSRGSHAVLGVCDKIEVSPGDILLR